MHSSNLYLSNIGKAQRNVVLSSEEADELSKRLLRDAEDYFQSAMVTFFDALDGVKKDFFSWATVKLYYVGFYSLRAKLALSGNCVFYEGRSPMVVQAIPGAATSKLSGNTHQAVIDFFTHRFPNDYTLSQEIGGVSPFVWLTALREDTNYKNSRFIEPIAPSHLSYAAITELRRMLTAYSSNDVYVFDEEHAAVAFVFRLLRDLRKAFAANPLSVSEVDFLRSKLSDRAGQQSALEPLLT